MNIRGGYNRLFVVAWVSWVLVAVGVGMKEERHYTFRDPIHELGSLLWWAVSTSDGFVVTSRVLVIVPAFVYGLLFVAGWATRWVVRGFRPPPAE
jgi:hypothetical protein